MSTVSKEDQAKISEAVHLSQEEKDKLYDAIGYTGEESFSKYPDNVILGFLNFFWYYSYFLMLKKVCEFKSKI